MYTANLISVGIPVFNAQDYLEICIKSVLNQTYENFELIIINDGSTDESSTIIKKHINDQRIRYIDETANKGLIFRLNQFIEEAKGQFLVRMDADDIMFPNRLEKQLEVLLTQQSEVVYSDAVSIDNYNQVIGYKKSFPASGKPGVLKGIHPIHPSVMATKFFFTKNYYREGFDQMEDLELWYRTIEKYTFLNIPEPLLFYRENSTHISSKHYKMYHGLKKLYRENNIPFTTTLGKLFGNRIKWLIYLFAENLKMDSLLLKRRYQSLNTDDVKKYELILTGISRGV